MAEKVSVDRLDSIVMGELDQYAGALVKDIEAAQKAGAKAAIRELKQTSPKRTGEYAAGWKSKTERTRTGTTTTIYNGDKPGLAHLLEFGHPIIKGGRTVGRAEAIPHIKKAEKTAIDVYEKTLKERAENGS